MKNPDPVQLLWREICDFWPSLPFAESARFGKQYARFRALFHSGTRDGFPEDAELRLRTFLDGLKRAQSRSCAASAERLVCSFPDELPITRKIPEIRAALRQHSVVIVCGATGSGKTTQLPKAALLEGFGRRGRIGCTQPRRLAASALAMRFSEESGAVCGNEVGYQVRFDDRTTPQTAVKFMTDGILLAEISGDPMLRQYDCLLLDEVHERSLNIDFLLGYVKQLLLKRPELRVLISSATLEAARLSEFFHGAPVVEVEGRLFPVEDLYLPSSDDGEDLSDSVARAVEELASFESNGDILVFLPGEREIRDAADLLSGRNYPKTEILPLFGRLSGGEQSRIFHPGSLRRIILATNVAETSITIPRIRFVIDSGLVRLSRYNPRSRIQELRLESVSRASANQRRGRCGRLRDGICAHLYSEEDADSFSAYTDPEIRRSSLAGVILRMAELRLPDIRRFPFLDPPSDAHIREGMRSLVDLGAMDDAGRVTRLGHELAPLPIDPHLGRILLAAKSLRILPEAVCAVAFLSIQDPRERPFDQTRQADEAHRRFESSESDFLGILTLWNAFSDELRISHGAVRKFAKKNFLHYRRLFEWAHLVDELRELFKLPRTAPSSGFELEPGSSRANVFHQALLTGLPRQIAMFDPEKRVYLDRAGKAFLIFPGSALARLKKPPKWILSFSLMETSRVFGRCNAVIQPEWLEQCAPHLCAMAYDRIAWDEAAGYVRARERVMAGILLIHSGRSRHYGAIDPEAARRVFIREALLEDRISLNLPWLKEYRRLLRDIHHLEICLRRPDSLLDTDALFAHFDAILPPTVCSAETLLQASRANPKGFLPDRDSVLYFPFDSLRSEQFPGEIESNGICCPLDYAYAPGEPEDGITLCVDEHDLNLLERRMPDYLVEGFLREKLELLLRCIPKSLRRSLLPLSECVSAFLRAHPFSSLDRDEPLEASLLAFLKDSYDIDGTEDWFESFEPPEHLCMKIAVRRADGNGIQILTSIPANADGNTRLRATHGAARVYEEIPPSSDWPAPLVFPDSVPLSDRTDTLVFPALVCVEELLVGVGVFLSPHDAARHHREALCRIFRLRHPQLVRQLKQSLKFPPRMELTLFCNQGAWRENLLDLALIQAARPEPLERFRDRDSFDDFLDVARSSVSEFVAEAVARLHQIFDIACIVEARLPDVHEEVAEDARRQLAILFRPGFLRRPDVVCRYPVYLKSLALRLERAKLALLKDQSKGAFLQPYVRKFQLAISSMDIDESAFLSEFFVLLEEARLAAYTPEIPAACKATADTLAKAWDSFAKGTGSIKRK